MRRIFVKVSRFADDVRIYIVKLYVLRQIFRADGRCVYLPDGVRIAEVTTEIVISRRARSRAAYVGYICVGIVLVHVFSVIRFQRDSATAFARAADGYEIRTQHIFHVVYLAVNAYIRDSFFCASYASYSADRSDVCIVAFNLDIRLQSTHSRINADIAVDVYRSGILITRSEI